MKKKKATREDSIKRILIRKERRRNVERLRLRGAISQVELAKKYNVRQSTIQGDLKWLEEHVWAERDEKSRKRKINFRTAQYSAIMLEAAMAWERSKGEVVTVKVREYTTPKGNPVKETTTETKVSGGDVAYLQIWHSCIKEIAKIEGLYVIKVDINEKHSLDDTLMRTLLARVEGKGYVINQDVIEGKVEVEGNGHKDNGA